MTDRDDDAPKSVRRLKRWPMAQKCRIVEETFVPGASVSIVARRHDVNANLVFGWRKRYRQGTLVDRKGLARTALPAPDLVRIGVVEHGGGIRPPSMITKHSVPAPAETGKVPPLPDPRPSGIIEIELRGGTRVRVDAGIDDAALRRVLAVVKEVA